MLRSSCLLGSFLTLFHVGVASAVGPPDSKSAETFAQARDRIVGWASGFVAKKRDSIAGFAKPEAPFGESYHYVDERTIFGKTAHKEECALHLGRRLESGEWVFNFYLENKKREVDSVSMLHENLGLGDDTLSFEGRMVLQSQPTVSNQEAVISLDLHATASSISLLSLEVYKSRGPLGEQSLSIVLDGEDNVTQATYRFINSFRIRDGRRVDPVTCYFDQVF
jgi:hypothetical protein